MADSHFIEVRAGRGEPPSLELRPGVELAPLSVGSGGAWQVTASGVRTVHLYVYFDGQTLFLQSADPSDPPRMDNTPVPSAWTAVASACSITFGQARLVFRPAEVEGEDDTADEDERTVAQAIPDNFLDAETLPKPIPAVPTPVPPAPRVQSTVQIPPRPFQPGAFAHRVDDESTRLQPIEDSGPPSDSTRVEPLQDLRSPGGVRPAAGAPWAHAATLAEGPGGSRPFPPPPPQPPTSGPVSSGAVPTPEQKGPPSGLLNVPPPSVRAPEAPETFDQKVKREWAATPPLKRGLLAAMPVGLVILVWVMFAGSPAPQPSRDLASTNPSASSRPSVPPGPTIPTVAPVPTPWPPVDTQPPPPPPPGSTGTSIPSPPSSATPVPTVNSSTDAGPNVDRRERQAADLVAQHDYPNAIRLYETLAAEKPSNPVYHEAARILRIKIETNAP